MKFPSRSDPAKVFLQPGCGCVFRSRLAADGTLFEGAFDEAIRVLLETDDGRMGDEYCVVVSCQSRRVFFTGHEIHKAYEAGIIGRA